MAKKKAEKKSEPKVEAYIDGYDWKWIMDNPDHPEHKRIVKEARKKKYI